MCYITAMGKQPLQNIQRKDRMWLMIVRVSRSFCMCSSVWGQGVIKVISPWTLNPPTTRKTVFPMVMFIVTKTQFDNCPLNSAKKTGYLWLNWEIAQWFICFQQISLTFQCCQTSQGDCTGIDTFQEQSGSNESKPKLGLGFPQNMKIILSFQHHWATEKAIFFFFLPQMTWGLTRTLESGSVNPGGWLHPVCYSECRK